MFSVKLNDSIVYCLFILMAGCFIQCDDDKTEPDLRSNILEYYYNMNNIRATNRFTTIMYNQTDSDHPVERFKVVHISDAHVSDWSSGNYYKSPSNLIEAVRFANQSELKINAMAATGDHINDSKKSKALSFLKSFFDYLYEENDIPTFPCYGNHDSNMTDKSKDDYLTSTELYNAFDNKNNYSLNREAYKNYYYADVPNPMGGTVRFISLDMLDQPDNAHNTLYDVVYSNEQIQWLGNVALKKGMTDQHHVILLNHYPFQPPWGHFLLGEKYLHSWQMVPEIIEAFRSKQSLQKVYDSYPGKTGTIPIEVNFDYTASPGDFICYMGGHAHITAQFEIGKLSNRAEGLLPQKMLLCTNMSPSEVGTQFNQVERKSESLTSNSFCLYAIDTKERNIYITFFGAYLPSVLTMSDYPDIQVIPY